MLKKTLGLGIFAAVVIAGGMRISAQQAQSTGDAAKNVEVTIQMIRQEIQDQRKQVMAANMVLTGDEAAKFWPVYDQYIQETMKVNDARWELMKSYATNYDAMSDGTADDLMKKSGAIQKQLIDLRDSYVPKFEKAVSAKKTALWYQIDRRLDLVIEVQLASMIPVVDATK